MAKEIQTTNESAPAKPLCVSRRDFLLFAGATTVSLGSLGVSLGAGIGLQPVAAQVAEYPRKKIAELDALQLCKPLTFHYPYYEPHCSSVLVKLGVEASGGAGPSKDIVAFNQLCTHQGGLLEGQFQHEYHVLGPCPIHLTTFDLRRHGMVVSGHATQGLPQVILIIEGNDIVATGMLGLIYGYGDNLADA